MPRFTFPEWTETLKKWIILLVLGAPVYLVALVAYGVTPEAIRIGYQPDQPVPYSHALHAGELGMSRPWMLPGSKSPVLEFEMHSFYLNLDLPSFDLFGEQLPTKPRP